MALYNKGYMALASFFFFFFSGASFFALRYQGVQGCLSFTYLSFSFLSLLGRLSDFKKEAAFFSLLPFFLTK